MGAVHLNMLCCHNLLTTKHHYVTPLLIILILLTMTMATCQGARIKREAGFYTTRYGRSDPMLRFPGLHTKVVHQPQPGNPHQADWRVYGDEDGVDGVDGYQLAQRYWPEEGSEQYHIFEVHLVSEHVWCEDYLVRSLYPWSVREKTPLIRSISG